MIDNQTIPTVNENTQGSSGQLGGINLPIPNESQSNPANTPKYQKFLPIFMMLGLAILGVGIAIIALIIKQKIDASHIRVEPTPTPIVQNINGQNIDPVATGSAFLKLQSMQASLNASISAYNPQDQSIAPPVLDLTLGFQK
jgi:hypothetical protein